MIGLVRPLSDDLDCKKQQNAINRKYSLMILKSDQSYSEGNDDTLSISTIVSSIADNEQLVIASLKILGDSREEILRNLILMNEKNIQLISMEEQIVLGGTTLEEFLKPIFEQHLI